MRASTPPVCAVVSRLVGCERIATPKKLIQVRDLLPLLVHDEVHVGGISRHECTTSRKFQLKVVGGVHLAHDRLRYVVTPLGQQRNVSLARREHGVDQCPRRVHRETVDEETSNLCEQVRASESLPVGHEEEARVDDPDVHQESHDALPGSNALRFLRERTLGRAHEEHGESSQLHGVDEETERYHQRGHAPEQEHVAQRHR
mmetsp:Transcript_17519/g.48022  ORF Transcript_17519/g.48022 Transcript_17519/m.48022 type:complete len:202 (-) Transcript_17519:2004-2609(-)